MMEYECKIYNNEVYGEVVRDVVLMPVINREKNVCYRCVIPAVCLDRRVYRLKSARGLFRICRVPAIEFNIGRVCVTPLVKDFTLRPVCDHGKRLPWEITRIGTTTPRPTANPLQTFYVLYKNACKRI